MRETFVIRLKEACGISPGEHVLVAVSGGADSTALLCFFCEIRETYPISVSCAHVEHGIRGAASVEDMRFVETLCAQKNIPFYGSRVDATAYARAHKCGLEDAARTLRYDSLMETAKAVGADAIALAHHQEDQAETVLLHAARGSDVRGLCAMRARRKSYRSRQNAQSSRPRDGRMTPAPDSHNPGRDRKPGYRHVSSPGCLTPGRRSPDRSVSGQSGRGLAGARIPRRE